MAKRRRLTPAASVDAAPETGAGTEGDPRPELETKARFPLGVARTVTRQPRAPIASVAGDAANRAAFDEVAGALASARAEGRLVQRLPLAAVEAGHLVRDRVALDEAEMETLMASLGARGQQTPVEVVAVGEGRWGLISGWRRLEALRRIGAESVLAFVREPAGAADAYLAMVEENEVRAGLSFYERARIAAEAVRLGLHPDASAAVGTLFASARPAKRSKILSFVALHEALGPALALSRRDPREAGPRPRRRPAGRPRPRVPPHRYAPQGRPRHRRRRACRARAGNAEIRQTRSTGDGAAGGPQGRAGHLPRDGEG